MKVNEAKGTVELVLTAKFIERYGAEAQRIADLVQQMAAEGDLDSVNDLVRCFSVSIAAAKQILRHVTQTPFKLNIPKATKRQPAGLSN